MLYSITCYKYTFLYLFICWYTLGVFHLLAIVNSAAMNVGAHICLCDPDFNFSGYTSRSGMLYPMVVLFLIFVEPLQCFTQWLHHLAFPPVIHKDFNLYSIQYIYTYILPFAQFWITNRLGFDIELYEFLIYFEN